MVICYGECAEWGFDMTNPATPKPLLVIKDLSVSLEGARRSTKVAPVPVLRSVNLAVEPGTWTAIVGPNGAGKTTLLRACANLLGRRDNISGTIALMGAPLGSWAAKDLAVMMAWLGTADAFSDGDLSALTAWDVVALGRLPHQRWWPALAPLTPADEGVIQAVMMQTHTWQLRAKPLMQMSSGERQRVHIARALAVKAKMVLMDEPLLNLDPPHQAEWIQLVRSMAASGQAVVSVLHELNAALYADKVVVLVGGRITCSGAVSDEKTRAAITDAFSNRIEIRQLDGHWVALPRL